MTKVANGSDESNDEGAGFHSDAKVIESALCTLDRRLYAEALRSWAADNHDVAFGAALEVERAADAIAVLDCCASGAASMLLDGLAADEDAERDLAASVVECAESADRFFQTALFHAGKRDGLSEMATGADSRFLATARERVDVLRLAHRRGLCGFEPGPPPGSTRAAQWAHFVEVAATVDAHEDNAARALLALHAVASVTGWHESVPPESRHLDRACNGMLRDVDAGEDERPDGLKLVRRALRLLGHEPDDFSGAGQRAQRSRIAINPKRLARSLAKTDGSAEATRQRIVDAVSAAGGVNGTAAKALTLTLEKLRELVAGDPALAAQVAEALATRH